jgi:hypothetical protein
MEEAALEEKTLVVLKTIGVKDNVPDMPLQVLKDISVEELEQAKNDVLTLWSKNLKPKGAEQPSNQRLHWLAVLYLNLGKPVDETYVLKYSPGKSCQLRHLAAQDGFNMYKGGDKYKDQKVPESHFLLADLENIYPGFIPGRRDIAFSDEIWTHKKKAGKNQCAACRDGEGKPSRWNPYKNCKLHQSHKNPLLPLTADNSIPLCEDCNKKCKDKYILDDNGGVVTYHREGLLSFYHILKCIPC